MLNKESKENKEIHSSNPNGSLFLSKENLMTVSSSPHIKSDYTVTSIMGDVIVAAIPALIWGIFIFGFRALSITLITVASCILFEFMYTKIMRMPTTIGDLSAVVTGMLLAFNLPVNAPLWLPVIGSAFAIIIVKMLFGGIGKNIVNPALAARIFLFISFPKFLSLYFDISADKMSPTALQPSFDTITSATPLAFLKMGELPDTGIVRLLLGQHGGCIGEVSAILLVAGGIYLMIKRVISWQIPVSFIATVAILTYFFPKNDDALMFMISELLSGGIMLGAFFMATDYVTSPITKKGKLIFGVGCGLITVFIRYFGDYPEGVSFAIMVMNLFVWYIDKLMKPVRFGGGKIAKK